MMKYNKKIATIGVSVALMALPFMAGARHHATMSYAGPDKTFFTDISDTLPEHVDVPDNGLHLVRSQMHLMARTYGDSIVLRWAPEDYVSWKYLNRYGYTLYKFSDEGIDTLAYQFKPLSKEEMLAKYTDPNDSIAQMVAELMWGEGRMKYNQTRAIPGSVEAMLELSEEQNLMFGFAELAAEWRPDLANDMAMRLVDKNVKKGQTYEYILQPGRWDPDSTIIFSPGHIENLENKPYSPTPLDIEITDSLTTPYSIVLEWPIGGYSSFEIERRGEGEDWHRVNKNPYVPFMQEFADKNICLFSDVLPKEGVYGYRILAHDAFGNLTAPSAVHTVKITDKQAPHPPMLTSITIDRPQDDPSAEIWARITWAKDSIEDDLTGYMPLYYNEKVTGKEWKPLLDSPVSPRDTMCVVEVTGLKTGQLVIAAYDKSGNMSTSMPQVLRVEDMKAPDPPQNFMAQVYNDGKVLLRWDPAGDDIDYYQIQFRNDTTHMWQILNDGGIKTNFYVDSLAVDVNQKYIYYRVRGTDYSTNQGAWSDALRVERPTVVPPTLAHLDSLWYNNDGINLRWVTGTDEVMSYHLVYRKKEGDKNWTVIMRCNADSVKAAGNFILVHDTPPFDRRLRYQYAMESWNTSGLSSGKTLIYSVLHQGSRIVDAEIDLAADYDKDKKQARLAWSVEGMKAEGEYYYSIYRKAPGDPIFRFVTTTTKDNQTFTDVSLQPGEQAEYYVKVMFKDGRRSRNSKTVKVTVPSR